MVKVKIFGAGSIGNHLAHGCRSKDWNVTICDTDPAALKRTQESIYPERYGKWDEEIRLALASDVADELFDLVIIGTPPHTHLAIARDVLSTVPPKVMLIEKPACLPDLKDAQEVFDLAKAAGTIGCVGYNHTLTKNTKLAEEVLKKGYLGKPLTITAKFREHWGGIFGAHPWLQGPEDSYLGFYKKGGGASGEHSHAINLWQHFAHACGAGKIVEVSALMDMVDDGVVLYDRICQLNVVTESGLVGAITQDVITEPAQKKLRIQGDCGFLEWEASRDSEHDSVIYTTEPGEVVDELIGRTRPGDFEGEIDFLETVLSGQEVPEASVSLKRGLDTMLVVAAAHLSFKEKRTVRICYEKGYSLESLELL